MKKNAKRFILLALFVAAVIAVRFTDVGNVLTFENLSKNRDALLAYVNGHYAASVLTYVAVYIAAVALNVPGAAILTMAGGFLFGTALTVLYANIGATAGAVLAFLLARYLLGEWVQSRYRTQLAGFNSEIERSGSKYLLTLRLIPVFPFFLINFLAGMTTVPLRTFLWTTSLGIIPAAAVFAFAGRQIGTISSAGEVLSPKVIIAFILLAFLALIPALISRKRGTRF